MGITRQEIDTILSGLDNDIARRKKEWAVEKSAPKTSYVAKTSVSVPESIPTLRTPRSDARTVQQKTLSRLTDPNVKLSTSEKKNAKQITDNYFKNEYRNQLSTAKKPMTEYEEKRFQEMIDLKNKINSGSAFMSGLIDSFSMLKKTTDKAMEKTGNRTLSEITKGTDTQNEGAKIAGNVTGKLSQYALGSQLMQSVPIVAKATGKAGESLAKLPVLNKVGSQHIANVLGDTALDVALDTVPTTIDNATSGKSAKDTTVDALKNLGTNVAFNVGGESLGAGLDALKKVDLKKIEADKQAQKALQKRVESVSVKPLGNSEKRSFAEGTLATAKEVPNNSTKELPSLEMQKQDLQNTKQAKINTQEEIAKSQKIVNDYANELKTATDKYVGMFRGNESTAVLSDGFKQSINNFVNNPSLDTLEKMFDVNSELNKTLQGNTYTYKLRGKQKVARTAKYDNEIEDILTSYYSDMLDNALTSKNLDIHGKSIQNNLETLHGTEIPTLNDTVKEITTNKDNAFKSSNTTLNPLQTESGMKLRSYDNKTVQKTDLPDDIKKEFAENPDVYKVLSNAETKANANAITNASTTEQAVNQFNVLLGKKDPTAIPLGYDTAKRLIDEGKREEAVTLIRNMSSELTKSGQFSQAAAITMMKSDPMTAMRYMERELDAINTAGKKKFGNKWNDFKLTDDEINAFSKISQGDTEKIKSLYDGISKRISETYPSTTWEKFVELRKMSFLINPRTHIRNTASNEISLPLRSISDRVSAIGERGYKAIINPDYQLTQSLVGGNSAQKEIANTLFETKWKDVLNNTANKWEDVGKNAIKDKRVFQTGWLEKLRQFDYKMLGEVEDNPFVKKNFTNRLGSYMHVNNITDINNVPEEAQIIAYQEALKATFKDDNFITNLFMGVKKSTGKFGDLVLPFTKTPANLTMRSIEYSPLGIAKAIYNAKNGAEAYQIIDDVAKFLTGTSAIALGYYLADKGFITGSLSQDKDKRNFEKQQGKQAYSIKFKLPNGDEKYVSYDWALPTSAMFIMGADIANAIKEDDKQNASVLGNSALNATKAGFNSIADQSSLTNLSDLFKADTATGKVDFAGNVLNTLTDIPSEMIPTLIGATSRAIDPNLRTTYDNTSEENTKLNQIKSKIPMLSKTLPESYDNWGNAKTRTNTPLESAFAQFVNPGTFSNSNITPLDSEINRLYEQTGDNRIFPKTAEWSVKTGGENKKLNNEEYANYQKSMGGHAYILINSLQKSEKYQNTSDEAKVNMSDDIYQFSNALAKSELFGYDIKNSDTYGKIYQAYKQYGPDGAIAYLEEKNALQNAGFTTGNKKAVEAYEKGGEQGLQQYANDKQLFDDLGLSMNSDKLNAYYNAYGSDGLKQLAEVKSLADSNIDGSISQGELIPTLQYLGYTGEQGGQMIQALGGELSEQAQQSYNDLGNDGVYQYYNNRHYADYDGNGSLKKDELIYYLQQTYSSRNEMAYWFDRLKPPQKGKSNNNPFY